MTIDTHIGRTKAALRRKLEHFRFLNSTVVGSNCLTRHLRVGLNQGLGQMLIFALRSTKSRWSTVVGDIARPFSECSNGK